MNYEVFKNLYQKFHDLPENIPQGGIENEENAWFYNLTDALLDVVLLVESQQNMDPEEFQKHSFDTKNAFEKLQRACIAYNTHQAGDTTDEMTDCNIAVSQIMKPLMTITGDLAKGQSLNQALKDSSWIKDIFNSDEPVKESPDYVPGQFSTEGMPYKELLDKYKADHDLANQKYQAHIRKISGDEKNPTKTIKYKLSLIEDYLNSNVPEKDKIDMNDLISNGYDTMEKRMDRKNIKNIRRIDTIMSEAFFGVEADKLYEKTQFAGEVERLINKDISDNDPNLGYKSGHPKSVIDLVESEAKKIRFNPAMMGISQEMIERFEKYSYPIQVMSANLELIREVKGVDQSPEVGPVLKEIEQTIANITGYLNDSPGAHCPTDEEFIHLATSVKDIIDSFDLLYKDGALYKMTEGMCNIYRDIYNNVPTIQNKLKREYKDFQKNLKEEFLQIGEDIDSNEELDSNKKSNMGRSISNAYDENLIDRSFYLESMYIRMARNPEFHKEMMKKATRALTDFANHYGTKDAGYTSEGLFTSVNFITGERRPSKQAYEEVYTTLIIGAQIQAEKEFLQKKNLSKVEMLRNPMRLNMKAIFSAAKPNMKVADAMHSAVTTLKTTPIFKSLMSLNPQQLLTVVQNPGLKQKVTNELSGIGKELFKGVNDKTLEALTQSSGFLGRSNTQSYTDVSDGIKNIFKKNAEGGATKEDFLNLYESLKAYSLSHDSHPSLDNGKLRANAAIDMMSAIGVNLAKMDPSLKATIDADRMVNMTRSKAYRDAVANNAKTMLKKLTAENANQIKEDYNKLPDNVKEQFNDCLTLVGLSQGLNSVYANDEGCELRGKLLTAEAQNRMYSRINSALSNSRVVLEEFAKNPLEALSKLDPELMNPEINNPELVDPELKNNHLAGPGLMQ